MAETRLLLFGDQTLVDSLHIHKQILHSRENPFIGLFFEQCCDALRHEASRLTPQEKKNIPDFTSLAELNERTNFSGAHEGIRTALLCASQLAHYIEYTSSLRGKSGLDSAPCVLGLSVGLLSAAAVALSPTIPALIPLAVEVFLISFRLGNYVRKTAHNVACLPAAREDNPAWSFAVPGMADNEAATILEAFHKDKMTPPLSRAYVSATSSNSVTISGPPSTLRHLFCNSDRFANRVSLPVFGPYHSEGSCKSIEIDHILRSSDPATSKLLSSYGLALPIMSTSTGDIFNDNLNAVEVLTSVIEDILCHPLRLQSLVEHCIDYVKMLDRRHTKIVWLGPGESESMLTKAIQKTVEADATVEYNPSCAVVRGPALLNNEPRTSRKPKLAIVGMAGRFPNAADHEKFWDLLDAGLDVHREVPKDRFNIETHYDPTGRTRNTSHTPYGCFIDEPGLFDPRFFNMSPREATQTDPMHRLGLATAYEALEMAGYVPNRSSSTRLERIGTFYGQTSDDWREINEAQDIDTYFITAGVRAFAPGRINYYFKFSGPSFSVDTACSSSAAALQLACTSLWAGDVDTAVTGGLNIMTNSDIFSGLSRGQFLSKTGNCQTFDNDADGYCRGDGIGSLVIKRLDDAVADNDRILGVILETATNHSSNAISITHPHAPTQEMLFKKVMDDAGIDPHEVNYVEMHGTGTQAGDGTEMKSVTNVFAPQSRTGQRKKSLHLGSVKANVGHGEAVSGVTAMIKCLLMLQNNAIPPHCGIKKTINQGFPQDLNARNVHIAFKPTPFVSRNGTPRRIFINNFSAAGGNTALLLEDAPTQSMPREDLRGDYVIAVSAKSKSALRNNAKNLIRYIKSCSDLRLADLSYTTTARRIQHNYRAAFACRSLNQAADSLALKLDDAIEPVPSVSPSIAFAYTGQGSHYRALGKQLFELSKQFRSDLQAFDAISSSLSFPSFLPLVTGDANADELSPVLVQVGLCSIQMALTRLWASWGVVPDVVVGHSLGEYAALNTAGVVSAADAIYLVGSRARLLEERCAANSHIMLATKSSTSLLREHIVEYPQVQIACVNGTRETVLAGTVDDIDKVAEKLSTQGTKCTKLNVQFAFHSSQVDPILADYKNLAQSVTYNKPQIPVISPLLGTVLGENETVDGGYLAKHARETVDFIAGLSSAQQLGLISEQTVWVEVGPHPVCMNFIKSELGSAVLTVPSLRKGVAPFMTISESLAALHNAGLAIHWNEYHKDFIDCVRMLDLPSYAFDNKTYWIQYTGDWNLRKGQVMGLAALPEPEIPKLSTTTVHRVVSEVIDAEKATVVVESDLWRPDLLAAISGHVVNGTALCPSSIYGDMAMTIGEYLYKLVRPNSAAVNMNVCHMEVFKPLIANDGGKGQTLRLTATVSDIASERANLVFSSGSGKGEVHHAKCHVDFGSSAAWLSEWQRSAYLINGRINGLKSSATSGKVHRMLRGMAYKLFGAFVEYDPKFRGMEEVILDSPELEATAHIAFQTTEADGNFVCSPYWIDSVCHLAGFIVNANDAVDSSKQVYVSHGWESMRFAEPLKADKTYRSYVKMQPLAGNMVAGDVYIFEGDRIIGMCGALKFQCIPRTLLNTFLPPRGAAAPSKAPAAIKAPPKFVAAPRKLVRDMKAATASVKTGPSVVSRVMDIIASEVGVDVPELADGLDFANMGVDSLMSLSISGRIREELDLDAPSSLFVDYPTVSTLKGHLRQYDSNEAAEEDEAYTSGSTTPSLDLDDYSSQDSSMDTPISPPGTPGTPSDAESLSMIIRQTISEEMGVDIQELSAADDLSALGMDSLMSLSILGILRERAGLSLPADFLADNQTIKAIETALHIEPPSAKPKAHPKPLPRQATPTSKQQIPPARPTPSTTLTAPSRTSKIKRATPPERSATSILLQGSPKTATKTFFLVPDGGGAPTSYVFLDEISPTLLIWGLTSPFVKTPEEFIIGVRGIATKYIHEIKRRQPSGPYNVGGWSAGGVISFEVARQLIDAGDIVATLIFIDTPCPLIIEPLPSSLHRFFGSIGLLGDGDGALEKLPPYLLPHFAASVTALSTYDAERIDDAKCPNVWAMWCEHGVCKEEGDPRPNPYPYGHAQWLLENRTDFGSNLWEEFVDEGKVRCRHMEGNHFSMMREPLVGRLTAFLKEALA